MRNDVERAINLNIVENTRDLGELKTNDGRTIKKGLLIRSGQLFGADKADVTVLNGYNIETIVDFRGTKEREEKPDAFVGEKQNLHLPVMREQNSAIEREEKKELGNFMVELFKNDPNGGQKFMEKNYRDFIVDEYQVSIYRKFVDAVLEAKNGAVLWHCAGGKDRAGFGAIVIETILGVTDEDIRADYLMTNFYNYKDIARIRERAMNDVLPDDVDREAFISAMVQICDANEIFLNQAIKAADELYGGLDGYIKNALKVTDDEINILRDRYLV